MPTTHQQLYCDGCEQLQRQRLPSGSPGGVVCAMRFDRNCTKTRLLVYQWIFHADAHALEAGGVLCNLCFQGITGSHQRPELIA